MKESMIDSSMIDTIIKGDAIEVLSQIPDNSVDLIFADPPYNLQLRGDLWRPNQTKVNAVTDVWDHFESFEEYDRFSEKWLSQCRRILKDSGSIWVIGTYHNIFRIGKIMQDLGYWIINDIVWIKTNPMPNFRGVRFTNSHETLIFSVKSENSAYTFHYRSMKIFNDDIQMRSEWEIPICGGKERIRIDGEKAHSTQKPEELLKRIILAASNPEDIVLDPFIGSGTTGAVSKLLGRHFIGIEREEKYIAIAKERIYDVTELDPRLLSYPSEIKPPRVPFGNLVSAGLIKPGSSLYSEDRSIIAKVLANGTIVSGTISGSIHSAGAALLGKPAVNGWNFWFTEYEGKFVSLNFIRNAYIEKCLKIYGKGNTDFRSNEDRIEK